MTAPLTLNLNFSGEIAVDLFAGGGGASLGVEWGLGRPVDEAVNHDADAIAMHRHNHPATRHHHADVWNIAPRDVTQGRPVGLLWASPDCTHHSKAKGGKPLDHKRRSLADVVIWWAKQVRPRIISLENVEEFAEWGPLLKNGRPCKRRKGKFFKRWLRQLRGLGYRAEQRQLRACDYGAPTIRKRLFIIARRDGLPIVWPEPTHGLGRLPYRTAADCIDWSLPCPSIFLTREQARAIGVRRPLADATLRRVANGVRRYVIEAQEPFIVRMGHYSNITGDGHRFRGQPVTRPLGTITATGNDKALVIPFTAGVGGRAGQSRPRGIDEPGATITTKGDTALVAAFLAKHYTGVVGSPLGKPLGTVTTRDHHSLVAAHIAKFNRSGDQPRGQALGAPFKTVLASEDFSGLVASHLVKLRGTCRDGQAIGAPLPTVTAGGMHIAEVRAFLVKYNGTALAQGAGEPLHTVTGKARFGLVMVEGEPHQIVDIGLRMLIPRELFRANGFPDWYVIAGADGRAFSLKVQIRLCGNSVPPQFAEAIVRANYHLRAQGAAA